MIIKAGMRQHPGRHGAGGAESSTSPSEGMNRRGYASFVSCRSCGEAVKCPHCDVTLTLHFGQKLVCHYCGYEEQAKKECPSCGSPYIGAFRAGTQ